MTDRVVVVGGGIAGLTVAYDLTRAGIEVVVLEAHSRPGGRLQTTAVGPLTIDAGPDAYLQRVPGARELVAELGLSGQIVHPSATRALVHLDRRNLAIPEATVLGVPVDLDAIAGTGLLTADGLARARRELTADHPPLEGDISVGALVRERVGDEVFERLVDPLISGINAGRADELSVEIGAPQLAAAAREGGSLIAALERQRSRTADPVFSSLAGGTQVLVDALARQVGSVVRSSAPARDVRRAPSGRWQVVTHEVLEADHVVIATPAHVAADQLRSTRPELTDLLVDIRFASVVMVTMVLPPGSLPPELAGFSGVLVPRSANRLLTACSFASEKWPHWAPGGETVLRVSAGRSDDDRPESMSDDALVRTLLADVADITGVGAAPDAIRVSRWPRSLAQLPPGHAAWLANLDVEVARTPGLHLVGASYEGVGIPATVRRSRRVAATIVASSPS